jgi:hypothetical protein
MASTETRPSFRLPWSSGPTESDEHLEFPVEPSEPTVDASSESSDMHDSEETQTPDMIETAAPATSSSLSEPSGPAPARRATKFMAELSHAMQAAAEHARNETMERFQAEAKAVVEEIHASATTEVADLRRKADDDVAAIRDWSKAEIARIREEAEGRVAARKTGLDAEIEAHASTVEARAERVTAVVAAFETEMGAFFDRLNGEEDPTRIATMAETMPDPPSLEAVAASIIATPTPVSPTSVAWSEPAPVQDLAAPVAETEIDFAAAEAEALSFDGDLGALAEDQEAEPSAEAASDATDAGTNEPLTDLDGAPLSVGGQTSTRVVVAGLISVASIANFKRSLARISGVWSIAVSSGPDGEFVFTVGHDSGFQLGTAIVAMSGFESKISGQSDGEIQVSTTDRDAAG